MDPKASNVEQVLFLAEDDAAQPSELAQRAAAVIGAVPASGIGLAEGGEAIRADSLVVMLSQALHSDDKVLLERCLEVGSQRVRSDDITLHLNSDGLSEVV